MAECGLGAPEAPRARATRPKIVVEAKLTILNDFGSTSWIDSAELGVVVEDDRRS